jgi:hypothetical protein
MVSRFQQNMTPSMTEDQFCQIIDAILNGKYSWACLLLLQFTGYNPLHYIPYRTYNRLMKDHNGCGPGKGKHKGKEDNASLEVENLPHLRAVNKPSRKLTGGNGIKHSQDVFSLSEWMAFWR